MKTLPKSKVLADRESNAGPGITDVEKGEQLASRLTKKSHASSDGFKLSDTPVRCVGDFVAIIPVAPSSSQTDIIVAGDKETPDVGIIVGVGPDAVNFLTPKNLTFGCVGETAEEEQKKLIGLCVKYSVRNIVCHIKPGEIPQYSQYDLKIISVKGIFCVLPGSAG